MILDFGCYPKIELCDEPHNVRKARNDPIPVNFPPPSSWHILPHLSMPKRGPRCKSAPRVFNLIVWLLYRRQGRACVPTDSCKVAFPTRPSTRSLPNGPTTAPWSILHRHVQLWQIITTFLRILHGDGTNTVAKKGGDGIGYSGHKHQQGEKVIAIIDNNGYVLAPLPVAPVNAAIQYCCPRG